MIFMCICEVVCLVLEKRDRWQCPHLYLCVCVFVFVRVLVLACVCWCAGVSGAGAGRQVKERWWS